jgi:predicted secreted Zn-dependent protease
MERENNILRQLCALLLMVATTSFVYASQSDIDQAARSKVVNAIANKLEAEYVFPDTGKKWRTNYAPKKMKVNTKESVTEGR